MHKQPSRLILIRHVRFKTAIPILSSPDTTFERKIFCAHAWLLSREIHEEKTYFLIDIYKLIFMPKKEQIISSIVFFFSFFYRHYLLFPNYLQYYNPCSQFNFKFSGLYIISTKIHLRNCC